MNDLFDIRAFKIESLIDFSFKILNIFGQISDSIKITELGFQYFKNLFIKKFMSIGEKITIKLFFDLDNKLYALRVDVLNKIDELGFIFFISLATAIPVFDSPTLTPLIQIKSPLGLFFLEIENFSRTLEIVSFETKKRRKKKNKIGIKNKFDKYL
jgi:hypothetical protein